MFAVLDAQTLNKKKRKLFNRAIKKQCGISDKDSLDCSSDLNFENMMSVFNIPEDKRKFTNKESEINRIIETTDTQTLEIPWGGRTLEHSKEIAEDSELYETNSDHDFEYENQIIPVRELSNYGTKLLKSLQISSNEKVRSTLSLNKDLIEINNSFEFSNYIPKSPSLWGSNCLDEQGMNNLSFFEQHVSKFLSIGTKDSNYLVKTFLCLASQEEILLNALAAWGGLFLGRWDRNVNIRQYMKKSILLAHEFHQFSSSEKIIEKRELMILLSLNLILLGIYVCAGDTLEWFTVFINCQVLIQNAGGIINVYYLFDKSNDIKFLLSNFQYHDLMHSSSNIIGSSFPIEHYELLQCDMGNYGIDPLQGCLAPIQLVLGDIINAIVVLKKERSILDSSLDSLEDSPEFLDRISNLRQDYFLFVENITTALKEKIANCKRKNYSTLLLEEQDNILHDVIFNLYKNVCEYYLYLYIRNIPPSSQEVRFLSLQARQGIKRLQNTKFVVSLCLPLIMVGITCCDNYDRLVVTELFKCCIKNSPVFNLKQSFILVKEAWERNPTGNICIDWSEICDDFGWKLSVS